ncbi:hypothetical protein GMORB2_6450 [Geosmithia morbida]|uniref:Uncharacterized protein n=1 Tax=Geosmithia morbida TaxID=1094350 RepID=A0A9P4YZ90_9HYPO|nr:uncharacterized protein GMORB2_6450 [Geosmithia morbida]KAF4123749.1 hypothetical protein GMORB2_6450 [Geosmithia morbida]
MASTPGESPATSTAPTVTLPGSTAGETSTDPTTTTTDGAAITTDQPTTTTTTDDAATSTTDVATTDQPTSTDPTTEQPTSTTEVPTSTTDPATSTTEDPTSIATEPSSTTEDSTTTDDATSTVARPSSTTDVFTTTQADSTATSVVVITTTREASSAASAASSTGSTVDPTPISPGSKDSSGGLTSGSKIAIGVAVPIGALVILAIVGLFWWKKRKARLAAEEEERRKEVEDYSYNPNAGAANEMREDSSAGGYRGWGTTTLAGGAGSMGRKASTTMSGGGLTYSDPASPKQGHASLDENGNGGNTHYTPYSDGEILGAMGPSAANNRSASAAAGAGGVNRGASNASSSYSAANQSDNSDGTAASYANGPFYDASQAHGHQHTSSGSTAAGGYPPQPHELPSQPVIRDNPARRNTRIENPAHYPQQSAGISQNF